MNINWKKTVIALFILLLILAAGFAIYNIFFYNEDIEIKQEETLSEEDRQQIEELQQIREERRGDDYKEPTEEEKEADIERQIQEIQDLRRR
jgi:flagellar basal body-associated protein FliL